MRHPVTDHKIVLRLDGDGHWIYFSVRDERDNGTIIDFVQRRGSLTLGAVRKDLRAWSGYERPVVPMEHFRSVLNVQERDRAAVREAFAHARVVSNSVYLNTRGIRPDTLCSVRFRGTWRIDNRSNLLFPHRDGPGLDGICGFEKKNAGFAGYASGGTKTIWMSNARPGDMKVVFAEAVIDALSYHQLQRDEHTRYASTSGSFGPHQAHFIERAITKMGSDTTVVIATDNDAAGDELAMKIADMAGGAVVVRHPSPVDKDWNDCLQQKERGYIRSLRPPHRGPER